MDLENDTGGLAGAALADHTLADLASLEGIVEAQPTNVRVGADALDAGEIFDLRGGWSGNGRSRLPRGAGSGRRRVWVLAVSSGSGAKAEEAGRRTACVRQRALWDACDTIQLLDPRPPTARASTARSRLDPTLPGSHMML